MKSYILVLIADILLACNFSFQKLYTQKTDNSVSNGLLYNILTGSIGCIILFFVNGFNVEFTPFSLLCAFLQTTCVASYTLISFKILKYGNLSLYTLFLMTGGMILPYIFGLIFLGENFSVMTCIGLVLIAVSIAIMNTGSAKPSKKQILLCLLVFVLNGFTSIIAKVHQVNTDYRIIRSESFAFWTNFLKALVCVPFYLRLRKKASAKIHLEPAVLAAVCFAGIASSISYVFQLSGAVNIPATVLYPLITGGSIILSSLAGLLFKEKLSKNQIAAIIICFAGTCMFI